jgi:hypothetical protein
MVRKSSAPSGSAAGGARLLAGAAGVDGRGGEALGGELWVWSSISAMSGLMTTVVPPRARPGSW